VSQAEFTPLHDGVAGALVTLPIPGTILFKGLYRKFGLFFKFDLTYCTNRFSVCSCIATQRLQLMENIVHQT
jgi:hypothetical protein